MWRRRRTTATFLPNEPSPNDQGNISPPRKDGDHDDEMEDSQQSQRGTWNANISFEDDDVIETIDSDGKVGLKKGKVHLSQVWVLEALKFVVNFNKYKQPIGRAGHLLVRFLGEVAKRGTLCPIGETSWHKVHKSYKLEILRLTRSKFHMPKDLEIDQRILSHVNGKWKTYRHKLKTLYLKPNKTEEQIASKVPEKVIKEQWIRLVSYWFSSKGKKLSSIGKIARAQKADCHTIGSKSFVQKKFEFEKSENREPNNLEVWKITHKRKDGSFVENTNTKEFMETSEKLVDECAVQNPEIPKASIEEAVFNELMYDEDDSSQRVVGYGCGVSRSQVFRLKANLRKSNSVDDSQAVKAIVEKETEHLRNAYENVQAELHRMTSALARNGIVLDDSIGREEIGRNMPNEEVVAHARSEQGILNRNHNSSRLGD